MPETTTTTGRRGETTDGAGSPDDPGGRRGEGPAQSAGLRLGALAAAAALLFTACENESLMPPEAPEGGELFESYVALGASITAGFQSGGINDSTQREAYSAKLAERMGTDVGLPLLQSPGCPPPFTDILAGERVGGGAGDTCALRSTPVPDVLHNVAVPGAEVGDVLENTGEGSNANTLTQLILGGRTQIEAAADAEPTFATVFAGGNDVLDAVRAGDPSLVTPPETFASEYGELVTRLAETGVEGAVLIGIPNLLAFDDQGRGTFPFLSLGAVYFQASQGEGWPDTFDVNTNCAPNDVFPDGEDGHLSAVPFGYGFGELFAAAQAGQSVELDCLNDPEVLTVAEAQQIGGAIQAYNQTIAAAAQEQGWAFVDATPLLTGLRDQGLIPPFPTIDDPSTPLFGPVYSQDGIHLAEQGHAAVADLLAEEINAAFGTSLPTGD
jgi:lysophospholipase L1-like esterase